MGIITKFRDVFKRKSCHFCKKTTKDMRTYTGGSSGVVNVCPLCVEYAERRAYKRV